MATSNSNKIYGKCPQAHRTIVSMSKFKTMKSNRLLFAALLSTFFFISNSQAQKSSELEQNRKTVLKFEEEFKNKANIGIVNELMSENFVHHSPIPNIPEGREGLMAIGNFVFSIISDIKVKVVMTVAEGDLVANRVTATGIVKETGKEISWTENHIYKLKDGKITEWWPEGGPAL